MPLEGGELDLNAELNRKYSCFKILIFMEFIDKRAFFVFFIFCVFFIIYYLLKKDSIVSNTHMNVRTYVPLSSL